MPVFGLAALFFLTAALYASVGFGGGSTYIALLALAEVDYRLIPVIALVCNIIVVTGGSLRFHLQKLVPWARILPIILLSVPAAWIGGMVPIERASFLFLLGTSLVVAALLLLLEPFLKQKSVEQPVNGSTSHWFAPIAGTGIGFVSGLVGIGGGVFLAPLLLLTRWADSRTVAATASVFILVNSMSGLIGQLMKTAPSVSVQGLQDYWPLFLAVLIGGQLGSYFASKALPETWIRRLTALLILYVAIRILVQQFG